MFYLGLSFVMENFKYPISDPIYSVFGTLCGSSKFWKFGFRKILKKSEQNWNTSYISEILICIFEEVKIRKNIKYSMFYKWNLILGANQIDEVLWGSPIWVRNFVECPN